MDVIKGIMDWVHFKTMVAPLILKVVYQITFVLLNVLGILGLLFYGVTGILGVIAVFSKDAVAGLIGAIVLAVILVVMVIFLVFYNIFLRIYFEVILLLFNMYDELKAINAKTGAKK